MAADLDLIIGPTKELQHAAGTIAGDVAGAIPAALLPRDKLLCAALFITVIARRHTGPADPQLAFDPVRAVTSLLVHHPALHIRQRDAVRRRCPPGIVRLDLIIRRVNRRLGHPTERDETRLRRQLP